MNLSQFDDKIVKSISPHVAEFTESNVYHGYNDLLLISETITDFEQQRPPETIWNNQISDREMHSALRRDDLISVLLKACYMIADVFLCRFLGGLHGRESMSMSSFIANGNRRFSNLHKTNLLPAYCITIYRNKLVAHHDFARIGSYSTSASGVQTLSPLPTSLRISDDDVTSLKMLRDKYESENPELKKLENHFELLTTLFYSVPVGEIGRLNPDRSIINTIAEKGGCNSQNAREIVEAIDKFCVGIVCCLNNAPQTTATADTPSQGA